MTQRADGQWAIVSQYIEGKTLAQLMEEEPEKKKEYLEQMIPGTFYRSGNYWISRQEGPQLSFPATESDFHISPDNQGFYVLWGRLD